MVRMARIGIIGGGPGGYEAALVAAQLGAEVVVVDRDGLGGSAVLTDCVPSKTLIATAESMTDTAESGQLGVRLGSAAGQPPEGQVSVDLRRVNARVTALAQAQSEDIAARLDREGVRVLRGTGRLDGPNRVVAELAGGGEEIIATDAVLLSTGAHPRVMATAAPDGERILTWEQIYTLDELPEHLIVVGSGVTGAEFASAFTSLGGQVTLVSSRDRVLPGEDEDAATVLEDVFKRRGMTVLSQSRANEVSRTSTGVAVTLDDGRTIEGSHCLMAVGSIPNTAGLGFEQAGVALSKGGFVEVDRVSRTSVSSVYAAGDCTGVLMLASVAAMQGRIAMWHSLGDAVTPLNLRAVSRNVFTDPEIATVGWTQNDIDEGSDETVMVKLPLATNARAKMQGVSDGFIKLFARPGSGTVVGGVIVAPRASELIFPVAVAVDVRLTVDQLAHSFTIYPSISGSVAEAARQLHTKVWRG
jgi:pyruvate/2-oxoglutarate dehydrogenase complex dihydrolipoamide dehydrogenase (E3) component